VASLDFSKNRIVKKEEGTKYFNLKNDKLQNSF